MKRRVERRGEDAVSVNAYPIGLKEQVGTGRSLSTALTIRHWVIIEALTVHTLTSQDFGRPVQDAGLLRREVSNAIERPRICQVASGAGTGPPEGPSQNYQHDRDHSHEPESLSHAGHTHQSFEATLCN